MVAAYTGWRDCRNSPQKAVTFGDGSPLDERTVEGIKKIMDDIAVAFPWQKGDVLWIDNDQVMHSRQPFPVDEARRVLAFVAK